MGPPTTAICAEASGSELSTVMLNGKAAEGAGVSEYVKLLPGQAFGEGGQAGETPRMAVFAPMPGPA